MINYVAGLLFNNSGSKVALIHKTHGPANIVGKWNAIGGKIKEDEIPIISMRREFLEEAGIDIRNWGKFLILKGTDWEVAFFHVFSSEWLSKVTTREEEVVGIFEVDSIMHNGTTVDGTRVVPNLNWIIPMALGHENDHVQVYEVVEKVAA